MWRAPAVTAARTARIREEGSLPPFELTAEAPKKKRKKAVKPSTSPMQRSIKWAKENGYIVEIVERRLPIPGKFVTHDCLGFGDLLAAGNGHIVLIQTTSTSNLLAHRKKVFKECPRRLRIWLENKGRFFLQGWSLVGPSYRKKEWTLKQIELTLADLKNPIEGEIADGEER